MALPKLVAFDLDYTLWDMWIDSHVTPPLRSDPNNTSTVLDRDDIPIEFYPDVADIIFWLRENGVHVAAASRTSAPKVAREALALMRLGSSSEGTDSPLSRAIDLFDTMEIYPGSKIPHFKQLHKKTGIDYSDMLFYDDERRNKEVESLGVTFQLVKNGLDKKTFEDGLERWRSKLMSTKTEDAA